MKFHDIDEEVAALAVFVLLAILTKNGYIAILLAVITYLAVLKYGAKPQLIEETEQTPTIAQEVVITPKKPKKMTYGDVKLSPNIVLNVLSDSIFITALKRYGKSVLLYNIIYNIHKNYTTDDIMMVLIDLKKTAFTILEGSPFIVNNTIYTDDSGISIVEGLLAERQTQFAMVPKGHVVDNLAKYHKVKTDNQPHFPHILVIIDEMQLLDSMDGNNKPNLNRIDAVNKISGAYGITFIAATQRGTAFIPKRMLSQFDIRCIGYLSADDTEYRYAGLDEQTIPMMSKTEGLFAVGNKGEGFVLDQTNYITTQMLEDLYASFPERKVTLKSSSLENNAMCMDWFMTLAVKPKIDEIMEYFDCDKIQAAKFATLWSKK